MLKPIACVDCKHYKTTIVKRFFGTKTVHLCSSPMMNDLVTGLAYCDECMINRENEDYCGYDANWFDGK